MITVKILIIYLNIARFQANIFTYIYHAPFYFSGYNLTAILASDNSQFILSSSNNMKLSRRLFLETSPFILQRMKS
jgi:hypothetical protein